MPWVAFEQDISRNSIDAMTITPHNNNIIGECKVDWNESSKSISLKSIGHF